ncbi:MAG: hypothetical protein KQ78_01483 [Candidatus Izimaplasma bacterium HR2]|nr:MAG: hypothetical protein KQ78_01483 [Candidatus Izimaplasma bacterium HR2]
MMNKLIKLVKEYEQCVNDCDTCEEITVFFTREDNADHIMNQLMNKRKELFDYVNEIIK